MIVLLITCLQYVVITVCMEHVTYLLFFFRSRSYPVPHRGERLQQRTVHVRNWNQNYSNWKVPHLVYICYLLRLNGYTVLYVAFSRFSFFVTVLLTTVSFCLFFATFSRYNFALFSFTDDILRYIRYKYVHANLI